MKVSHMQGFSLGQVWIACILAVASNDIEGRTYIISKLSMIDRNKE